MRKCLGYLDYDCPVDLTGDHWLRKRCPDCVVKHNETYKRDWYLEHRPELVRKFRRGPLLECKRCGKTLPAESFHWKNKAKGTRQSRCKQCDREGLTEWLAANRDQNAATQKAQREADPDKFARINLRRSAVKLGLDPDEIEAHYDAHCGLCDICSRPPWEAMQPKKRLSIDHDHATGKFRGLLCHDCNIMLGNARDDPIRLRIAAEYLEKQTRSAVAAA